MKKIRKELYFVIIDLEKAFNHVPGEVIWWSLRKKGVMAPKVSALIEMNKEGETSVKLEGEYQNGFKCNLGTPRFSTWSTAF